MRLRPLLVCASIGAMALAGCSAKPGTTKRLTADVTNDGISDHVAVMKVLSNPGSQFMPGATHYEVRIYPGQEHVDAIDLTRPTYRFVSHKPLTDITVGDFNGDNYVDILVQEGPRNSYLLAGRQNDYPLSD